MVLTTRAALFLAAILALVGGPALADGNAKNGEDIFKKTCVTCHSIGKAEKAKTGPNLFGVFGRKPALFEGFKYSKSYAQAAEKGTIWDEKALHEYLDDPLKFIRAASGDAKGQSKMVFNLKKEKDREDVIAYLKTQK